MDKGVSWSDSALEDLEQVAEYISKDSPNYASAFVNEVLNASKSLDRLFERGRIVPEFSSKAIREIFVRHYRLIY